MEKTSKIGNNKKKLIFSTIASFIASFPVLVVLSLLISSPVLYIINCLGQIEIFKFSCVIVFLLSIVLVTYLVFKTNHCLGLKEFLQKNNQILTYFNIFDFIFILSFIGLNALPKISEYILWIIVIVIFLILPLLRTLLIKFYLTFNKKGKLHGQTYFLSFIYLYLISFFQIILYVLPLIYSQDWLIYIYWYPLIVALSYFFKNELFKSIDQGPESVKSVWLKILSYFLLGVFIFALYLFESELISILSWFLPVLIPVFIGEINSQTYLRKNESVPEATPKMKKHIYSLQMLSFNTLLLLNLSVLNLFDNKSLKIIIIELLEKNSENTNFYSDGFYATCIIICLCFTLSVLLSISLVSLLRAVYLDKSSGYFIYKPSNNKKFKKNIHKRRN